MCERDLLEGIESQFLFSGQRLLSDVLRIISRNKLIVHDTSDAYFEPLKEYREIKISKLLPESSGYVYVCEHFYIFSTVSKSV